jgi:histidinol-phosphate aminotransferase
VTGVAAGAGLEGALALIKPSVRAQAAYTLEAHTSTRKLNQNEAPEDIPSDLKRAILDRAAQAPWHRYPGFFPDQLAERIAARHGWRADGVLIGNGSNEVIQAALTVAVAEGDVVLAPQPTFSLYRLLTGVLGGRYVPVPLGAGFRYDVDAFVERARAERAKVVVLNSPNNPTGSPLPEGAVDRLVRETEALILADEAYQEFGGPTALEVLRQEPRVVIFRTFSKAMGMAGLRFGYALAHPAIAREIAKAKLPYNVNALTLAAAELALEQRERFEARIRQIVAERERLFHRLVALRGVEVFPSSANFLLLRFRDLSPEAVFTRLLDEAGILVRDVSRGPGLAGCLRITVGTPADNDAVLAALVRILG